MGRFYKDKNGYPRWRDSDDPVHKSVAENKYGRELRDNEVVHHRDGDKGNFRRDNLVIMDRSDHSAMHAKKRRCYY